MSSCIDSFSTLGLMEKIDKILSYRNFVFKKVEENSCHLNQSE